MWFARDVVGWSPRGCLDRAGEAAVAGSRPFGHREREVGIGEDPGSTAADSRCCRSKIRPRDMTAEALQDGSHIGGVRLTGGNRPQPRPLEGQRYTGTPDGQDGRTRRQPLREEHRPGLCRGHHLVEGRRDAQAREVIGHDLRRPACVVGDERQAHARLARIAQGLRRSRHGVISDVHDTIEIEQCHVVAVRQ